MNGFNSLYECFVKCNPISAYRNDQLIFLGHCYFMANTAYFSVISGKIFEDLPKIYLLFLSNQDH